MPRKKVKAQKTTKTKSGKVTQTVNVYVSKRGGGTKQPSAPRRPQPSMSDILSVIDRRQGYAFEPLMKPTPPIAPALDPRLDAFLTRIDEKYATSFQTKEPPNLPVRAPSQDIPQPFLKPPSPLFGSSTDYGGKSLSDLIEAEKELPNLPGGIEAFRKMESDVLRGMGINPETGSRLPSRLPSPKSAEAAVSEIPMPLLSIPPPIEASPIKRVPKRPNVGVLPPPGSGKQEAAPGKISEISGDEFNMARVMKYDKERLDKLKRQLALPDMSPEVAKRLQQDAIKARTAWLRTNNLQEFGRASPENVSNFQM